MRARRRPAGHLIGLSTPNGYGPARPPDARISWSVVVAREPLVRPAHGSLQPAERRRVPHALAPQSQEEHALTGGELSA